MLSNLLGSSYMRSLFVAAAALLSSGAAHAATYVEQGDAGQTLATAATTLNGGPPSVLTGISGSYSGADADLFKIYISNPAAFSASTANSGTSDALDTELFLLDADGHAIAVNDDDASGTTLFSTLPVGNSLYATLAPGSYYLGIADSGNEPVNSVNQLLFQMGYTTSVRGAAGGLNPTTLADFDGNVYEDVAGGYTIALSGVTTGPAVAAVPEPVTWALMIGGFGLVGGAMRRAHRTPGEGLVPKPRFPATA